MLRQERASSQADDGRQQPPQPAAAAQRARERPHLLRVDPMEIEIGYILIPLADAEQGGNLLGRVTLIRRQMALELGIILPTIRVRDNPQLGRHVRRQAARRRGRRGEVRANRLMAMNPGTADGATRSTACPRSSPPSGCRRAGSCPRTQEHAEMLGYTVVDPTSVITTHLSEVIRQHAPSILSRQDVQALLDHVKSRAPGPGRRAGARAAQHRRRPAGPPEPAGERVSIRDLVTILESLADTARSTRDPDQLGERVRQALGRAISRQNIGFDGRLSVLTLSPGWQQSLAGALQTTDTGSSMLLMDAPSGNKLIQALSKEMERVAALGHNPILLCPARLRLALRRFTSDR